MFGNGKKLEVHLDECLRQGTTCSSFTSVCVLIHLFSLHAPSPWSNTTCIVYRLHVVSFYTLYI